MSFFSITPRSKEYLTMSVGEIPLRVVFDDGVKFSPDIKFNKIDLTGGYSLFKNQSGVNDSFKITVLLHKDDMVYNTNPREAASLPTTVSGSSIKTEDYLNALTSVAEKYSYMLRANLITVLDYWIRNAEPFFIVSDAVGVEPDELWLVTEQKNRKQARNDGYVEWDLTFTKYYEVTIGRFNKNTDVIDKALAKKNSSSSTNTNSKTALRNKLKKCDHKVLKYSKEKKVVECVKVMQEILYNAGSYGKNAKKKDVVDGWYGKTTREAVKAYKKKYKKDYGLNEYGDSVDYKTWQVMCGTAKKVTTVTSNKTSAKTTTATIKSVDAQSVSKSAQTNTVFSVDSQVAGSNNFSNNSVKVNSSNAVKVAKAAVNSTVKKK